MSRKAKSPTPRRPTTMARIARALGISRTTVSLILKGEAGKYRISDATVGRVQAAVAAAGYRPNYFARALNTRSTRVVGIVFPNVFEAFMSEVVKGIEDVLYPAGYTMMLCTSRFDRAMEQRNIEQLLHRGVDGILLAFSAPFRGERYDYSHLRRLAAGATPVVLIDRTLPGLRLPSVVQDDCDGARQATAALIAAGCGSVGLVTLDIDVSTIRQRCEGFSSAIAKAGIKLRRSQTIRLRTRDRAKEDLAVPLGRLLESPHRPDGLFVTTSGLALRVLDIVNSHGLVLNENIRIARFGSDPPYQPTGMFCVSQPHLEMGRRAAELLLTKVSGVTKRTPERIVLPCELLPPQGVNI
jgi:LacI family transcriptional regulator